MIRCFAILMMILLTAPANAQTSRLELGRRLQRFERAWEVATPAARVNSVEPLKVAVTSFFSLNLAEAGRQLDRAWLAVRGKQATALENEVLSLQFLPAPVCADVTVTTMTLQARPFYDNDKPLADNVRVRVSLRDANGTVLKESDFALNDLSNPAALETGALPEGDHRLTVTFVRDSETYELPAITVSRIAALDDRLSSLEKAAASLKASASDDLNRTMAATLRDEVRLIRNLSQGRLQEADFPILSRLQFSESLAHDTVDPTALANSVAGKSDIWMTLAKGTKTASVRLRFPASLEKPIPVLFVFHGAGGSENMFFETYGAGRVIREAEKRGWLVVSPGQGMFGLSLGISDMLDVLEPFAKLDRSRIMVLGHSMGAAQVMTQVQKHPSLPIAAVALGGGSRMAVRDPSQAPKAHWFVAAGEQDFGRSGARQLHRSLTDAGLQSQYRDYPDVEHLVIVQAAIDDSFKFLDEVLSGVKE